MWFVFIFLVFGKFTIVLSADDYLQEFLSSCCLLYDKLDGQNKTIKKRDDCLQNTTFIYNSTEDSESDLELSLFCRTGTSLAYEWTPFNNNNYYLIEIESKNSSFASQIFVNNSFYSFHGLIPDTAYRIRLWEFTENNQVFKPVLSEWTYTSNVDTMPLKVQNLNISEMNLDQLGYRVSVTWTPNKNDSQCLYDIIWFSDDGSSFRQIEVNAAEEKSFEATLGLSRFDTNYTVIIRALNGDLESEKINFTYSTPTCLESFYSLEICAPSMPENITAYEEIADKIIDGDDQLILYNIKIIWDQPEFEPDNYIVKLASLLPSKDNQTSLSRYVNGNETEVLFQSIDIGIQYMVMVYANSSGGVSPPGRLYRHVAPSIAKFIATSNTWLILTIILGSLGIIAISFVVFTCRKQAKFKRYQERYKNIAELRDIKSKGAMCITSKMETFIKAPEFKNDSWELMPDQIILQNGRVLGEGAFGLVREGYLIDPKGNGRTTVAVKMLKDTPVLDQINQFLREIEIMKSVGSHPNLVSIIGCCTNFQSNRPIMLVVEYCELGDLQNYLRKAWEKMVSQPQPVKYENHSDLDLPKNFVSNKLYDMENTLANEQLKPSDLLSFARQIAIGMEFLSNLKVVHRDLAARNVLVCADRSVKVADFGLSRDVYRDNVYQKKGNSKIPIKWMAIECLTHQIYTSHSDVWSFGILLWEIVTLGGNPYPSIPTNELLYHLKMGYRMEKPRNCGQELYDLMASCWKTRPKERPTFTELRKSIDNLLESITMTQYLDLEMLSAPDATSLHHPVQP